MTSGAQMMRGAQKMCRAKNMGQVGRKIRAKKIIGTNKTRQWGREDQPKVV